MTNEQLVRSIKAELAASGVPFDLVEVNNTEIRVTQIGLHEALPIICKVLDAAGLWKFDGNPNTEDARAEVDDSFRAQKTVNILDRVPS